MPVGRTRRQLPTQAPYCSLAQASDSRPTLAGPPLARLEKMLWPLRKAEMADLPTWGRRRHPLHHHHHHMHPARTVSRAALL